MADELLSKSSQSPIDSLIEAAKSALSAVATPVQALVNDPYLGAFASQGKDEIGLALKAFPESLQTSLQPDPVSHGPYAAEADQAIDADMDRGR